LTRLLALLLLVSCSGGRAPRLSSPGQAGAPVLHLWAGLTPGQYAVGVRSIDNITLWYPATAGGEVVRFRDYVPLLEDLDAFLHAQHTPDETIVELFDSRMYARRDAPAVARKFPLVLIAQGNGNNANDQAILAEFIASHGYKIATVPGPIVKSESEMLAKAQEQAEAFERVVKTLGADDVIVIGHSFGARSMLVYAARNPTRALVSLDGGIGTSNNVDPLKTDRPLPAILHLYEDADAFMKPDFTLLRSLRTADLKIELVDSMHHVHFSSWGFISAALPDISKVTKATRGTKRSVTAAARRVLEFISSDRAGRPITAGETPALLGARTSRRPT
jgi:pimeloyl-ACP methyl ester carboxylesterase